MNKTKLEEYLYDLPDAEIISLYNDYCDAAGYPDNHIFCMDEFNDIMRNDDPMTIACKISYGNFDARNEYFWFNGTGDLESHDSADGMYLEAIYDYIIETGDDLGDEEIREILDEE